MSTVFISGQKVSLNPKDIIGRGGEAEVYSWNGKALKIYKTPDHVDLTGDPHAQRAAVERLAIHERKLPAFPKGLPGNVIAPIDVARDGKGKVAGYTMQFLSTAEVLLAYADRNFCQKGITYQQKLEIMANLYETVERVHSKGIVMGDFNDLNVLVAGTDISLVDCDSFQYTANGETFFCTTFTNKFVDPMLCDPKGSHPSLFKPHNTASDWYAFNVMLFQLLLFVDPYGGVYKPKDKTKQMPHDMRPLKRITVFNPEVKYPKPAVPYGMLEDDVLEFFRQTFEADQRHQIQLSWIRNMRWTSCINCGIEHARNKCPVCAAARPGVVTQVVQVRGQVVATREFKTDGVIVYAAHQAGKLRYLYHEQKDLAREDGLFKLTTGLVPGVRYRIYGDKTLLGNNGRMITVGAGMAPEVTIVDNYGNIPMFDANSRNCYWVENGQLKAKQSGDMVPRYIGDVLQNQTLFWVGEDIGFGFYRAGAMSVAFTFDAHKGGLNDSVKLPPIKGQLVDSTCCFSKNRCWFLVSTQENGKTINRCYLIKLDGTVVACAEAEEGDGSWLGTIRGNCAIGTFLLVGTDDGIVRVEESGKQLVISKEFPDTEPWVNCRSNLFPGPGGVYVFGAKDITLLKIS